MENKKHELELVRAERKLKESDDDKEKHEKASDEKKEGGPQEDPPAQYRVLVLVERTNEVQNVEDLC